MLWTSPLDSILGSRTKVQILRCLWRAEGEALSGREIARRVDLSHTGVLRALEELGEQDVVWPSADRTGIRYRLNRTSEIVRGGLMPLFALEASANERVKDHILEAVPEAVSIVIFGSVARGDDRADSDLDVLVVIPDGLDRLEVEDRLQLVEAFARFGKLLMPIFYPVSELREAHERGVPLIENILREGVPVHGPALDDLVRARVPDAG